MPRRHAGLVRVSGTTSLPLSPRRARQAVLVGALLAMAAFGTAVFFLAPQARAALTPQEENAAQTIVRDYVTSKSQPNDVEFLWLLMRKSEDSSDAFAAKMDETLQKMASPADEAVRREKGRRLKQALDDLRYQEINKVLKKVVEENPDLEAVVRTGSSGLKHRGVEAGTKYKPLLSDDDITFVGKGAAKAKERFNSLIEREGLGKFKARGFTIHDPGRYGAVDQAVLNLLDPEKFVGQSAMGGIRSEMLEKGAVVYAKTGPNGALAPSNRSLKEYLASPSQTRSWLDSLLDDAARRYGPLTMAASAERQIVQAHGGWEKLTPAEQAKYLSRTRKKIVEARGGVDHGDILPKLEAIAAKASGAPPTALTPAEETFLLEVRRKNFFEAFTSTNKRLLDLVRAETGNVMGNAEIRKAATELATGFAVLKDLENTELDVFGKADDIFDDLARAADGGIAEVGDMVGGNAQYKKLLAAARHDANVILEKLNQWRGKELEFLEFLESSAREPVAKAMGRLAERTRKFEGKLAQEAATAQEKNELLLLRSMSEKAKAGGEEFYATLIKNPKGRILLGAAAMAGAASIYSQMRDAWRDGGMRQDLADAAFALTEFIPGALTFKKWREQGMSPEVVWQFVKEGLYLGYFPAALTLDAAEMGVDLAQGLAVSNYHDQLVDVLAANGRFEAGRFKALELPDGRSVPREDLAKFLRSAGPVTVKNPENPETTFSLDISKQAALVHEKQYVANDPALGELKKAYQDQVRAVNKRERLEQILNWEWEKAGVSFFNALIGWDEICRRSPEKWCKLLEIHQTNMVKRANYIFPDVMVPHLIAMAEDAHTVLDGQEDMAGRLGNLQRELEELRGSPLGVDLAAETARRADTAASASRVDASPQILIDEKAPTTAPDLSKVAAKARGRALLEAVRAYEGILTQARDLKQSLLERTGYGQAAILGFQWSGDPAQDALRANQSKAGFAKDLARMRADIAKIKGSEPAPSDATDRQAFALLAEVIFPERTILDAANGAKPGGGETAAFDAPKSPKGALFHDWYAKALDKVKALYASQADLEKLVEKGARIVALQNHLKAGEPGLFEVRVTEPALRKLLDAGQVGLEWDSDQLRGAFSDPGSAKTRFQTPEPGTATLFAVFRRNTEPSAEAELKIALPVVEGQADAVLELLPESPEPGGQATARLRLDPRHLAMPLSFQWGCENCQATGSSSSPEAEIQAPESGKAVVSVAVRLTGDEGSATTLAELSRSFETARKTGAGSKESAADANKSAGQADATADVSREKAKSGQAGDGLSLTDKVLDFLGLGQKTVDKTQPGKDVSKVADPKAPRDKPGTDAKNADRTKTAEATGKKPSEPATPEAATSKTDSKPGNAGEAATTTGANGQKEAAAPVIPSEFGDWKKAMEVRDACRTKLADANLPDGTRKRYADGAGAAEDALRAFWRQARERIQGLTAFLDAHRADVEAKYAEFAKNAPKESAGTSSPGAVVDLEGEDASSQRLLNNRDFDEPSASCLVALENQKIANLKYLEALKGAAGPAEKAFAQEYASDAAYLTAMKAYDALLDVWSAQHPHGFPAIPRDWKSKGLQGELNNPCDPKTKTTVTLAAQKKEPGQALSVTLKAGRADGQGKVAVTAATAGGAPPYRYRWRDAVSQRDNAAEYAVRPGSAVSARVSVLDAEGAQAEAELALESGALVVSLTKTSPAAKEIPVGGQAAFAAALSSDGRPVAAGDYLVRWEPSTDVRFAQAEAPGLTTNTAVFTKTGRAPVWVEVLRREGGATIPAGESNQIEIEVVGPKLALTAEPAAPLVGQEVRVTAVETPKVSDEDAAFWWEIKGDAANPGATQDQRVFTFTPKNDRPVTVVAHLKSRINGEELARAEAVVTAGRYEIAVENLGPVGPKPRTWDPQRKELVELEHGLAAHQNVRLKAGFKGASPPAASQPLRYAWSLNEDGHFAGNSATQEVQVNRDRTGTLQAEVTVSDKNGLELGKGQARVEVTVSQEDVQGAKDAHKARELMEQARKAWTAGELDQALQTIGQAASLAPKDQEIGARKAGWEKDKAKTDGLLDAARGSIKNAAFDKARQDLDQAKVLTPRYPPIAELEKELDKARRERTQGMRDDFTAIEKLVAAKAFSKALEALRELETKYAPLSEEGQKRVPILRQHATDMLAKQRERLEGFTKGERAFSDKEYRAANEILSQALNNIETYCGAEQADEVAKARDLLTRAKQEMDKKGKAQADCDKRLALVVEGSGQCRQKDWDACAKTLERALNGAECDGDAAKALDKARDLLAKAKKEGENQRLAQADCDKRLALVVEGSGQCKQGDWDACAKTLERALDGAECDGDAAKALDKARDLLAKAKKEGENQRLAQADCDKRLALVVEGSGQCKQGDWDACAKTLERALDGAECDGDAAKALDKARDLLAKAKKEGENQRLAQAEAKAEEEASEARQAKSDADCDKRLALVVEGSGQCRQGDWEACAKTLERALDGAECDGDAAKALDKTRDLLAKAKKEGENQRLAQAEAKAEEEAGEARQAKSDADCDKRLALVVEGSGQCKAKDWGGCAVTLERALDGANCSGDAGKALDKAQDLLAKAKKERENERRAQAEANKERGRQAQAEADRERERQEEARKSDACEADWKRVLAKGKEPGVDREKVIGEYQALLRQCPDYCGAMNNIGAQLIGLGRKKEALGWFEKASACKPENEQYKKNILTMRKELAEETKQANAGPDCQKLFKAALGRQNAGDLAGAEAGYLATLKSCPEICGAMNNLGVIAEKRNRNEDALRWYQKAAACNPDTFTKAVEAMKKKIKETAVRQGPSASPTSPSASSGGFDGVYEGRAGSGGYWGHAVRIRVTVKGNNVFLDFPDGELKRRQGATGPQGSVDASGSIRIKIGDRHQWQGKISGKTASGSWIMELPDLGPMFPKGIFKDAWSASKTQ